MFQVPARGQGVVRKVKSISLLAGVAGSFLCNLHIGFR